MHWYMKKELIQHQVTELNAEDPSPDIYQIDTQRTGEHCVLTPDGVHVRYEKTNQAAILAFF